MKNNTVVKYEELVNEVITTNPFLEEKGDIIESINESYFNETGMNLPSYLLCMLTDWYLSDILKDKSVDKVTNTEYAILSHRQLKRRDIRECAVTSEIGDYLDLKYRKNLPSLAKTLWKETV